MAKTNVGEVLVSAVERGSIPPFVYCYPPRSSYRPFPAPLSIQDVWDTDLATSLTRDLNVYIHVPFCRYKCGFCNLYTVINVDDDMHDAYVDAVCADLRRHERIIQQRNLRTIYIGGGTPSLLKPRHFEQLFGTFDALYPNWRAVVDEVCIEATPDSIVATPDAVGHLLELGLTRINMGVQSLEDDELVEAGRTRARRSVVCDAAAIIRNRGVPNLSTDLIMGFASQDDATWLRSVVGLIALEPETVSTYFLTVRPDAWFSRTGKHVYQRSPKLYERYDVARSLLLDAGYVQESNVRYKKPGRGGYRQKVLQFRGVPVLGIGAGARTYTNTVDYLTGGGHQPSNAQVRHYIEAVHAREMEVRQGFVFDDAERCRKRFALDLFDLDLAELEPFRVWDHRDIHEDILSACVGTGLARCVGPTRYQLTSEGYKYRDIVSWLFFSDEVVHRDREFYAGLHAGNTRAADRIGSDEAVTGLTIGRLARLRVQ